MILQVRSTVRVHIVCAREHGAQTQARTPLYSVRPFRYTIRSHILVLDLTPPDQLCAGTYSALARCLGPSRGWSSVIIILRTPASWSWLRSDSFLYRSPSLIRRSSRSQLPPPVSANVTVQSKSRCYLSLLRSACASLPAEDYAQT